MNTPTELVIGVDPGGRSTGIVAVDGRHLLAAAVLDRATPVTAAHGTAAHAWAAANLEAIAAIVEAATVRLLNADRDVPADIVYAVEDVRAPNPHVRRADGNALTNLDGILATAIVAGAIHAAHPAAIAVPAGGNGLRPDQFYPTPIRPRPNPHRKGPPADRLRHARAAYDVAQAARLAARRPLTVGDPYAVEPVLYRVDLGDRPGGTVRPRR